MTQGGWPGIIGLNTVALGIAAQAYARAGIPVFPLFGIIEVNGQLRCECPSGDRSPEEGGCEHPGKHPRVKWTQSATTNIDQVREWWERFPNSNIGIPTGNQPGVQSGWCVLDLDTGDDTSGEAELDMWLETELGLGWSVLRLRQMTLVQHTGSGGVHIVLKCPDGIRNVVRWLPYVDIKGPGGYIIASPSKHISGKQYRWVNENAPCEAPDRLLAGMRLARGGSSMAGTGGSGAGGSEGMTESAYRKALLHGPSVGTRDVFFNQHAFLLRKRGVSKVDATQELRALWEKTPGGGINDGSAPYAWVTVLEKIERIWDRVEPDEDANPITSTMRAWAQGSLRLVASNGERVDVDNTNSRDASRESTGRGQESTSRDGFSDPGGGTGGTNGPSDRGRGPGSARVVNEPPRHVELATEFGTALRLARVLGDKVRFVHGIGWYVWNGTHWQLDESKLVVHLMHEVIADIRAQAELASNDERDRWVAWAISCESAGRIFSILRLAESVPSISLLPSDLDSDPYLLATQNGTLDLRTGELVPEQQARMSYCTQSAAVPWDPEAECPHWQEHVRLVSSRRDGTPDPSLESFLMRWAGYTLTGLVNEQKFAFLYGDGNNGKNVFVETLMKVMGTYAITGSAKLLTGTGQEHETVIADLAGPRLVFVDETPRGRINESRVKQLTGSSRIRARRISKDSFEFDARFKLWIAGNHKPRVSDTSEGLWRRLDLIPFDTSIPREKRVRDYADVLFQNEGPGILRMAVEGFRAYQELGLSAPYRVDSAKRNYREEENVFGQFVSETFDVDADEKHWTWHPNPVIHGLYEAWCHSNGVKHILSMQQLSDDLERNHFRREPKTRRIKTVMGSTRVVRGWWGPPLSVEVPAHLDWSF